MNNLRLHGHPKKESYATPNEWPFISGQMHWNDPPEGHSGHDHHIAHTHIEAWAPLYAEIPRNQPLTIKGRIQLFHTSARFTQLWGPLVRDVIWEPGTTLPIQGDPTGVVIKNFTLVFDQALSDPTNAPQMVPENGWYIGTIYGRTEFQNGARTDGELFLPFYAKGDPNVPEDSGRRIRLGAHSCTQSPNSIMNGHGCPQVEIGDTYIPLGPVTERTVVTGFSVAYQLLPDFPGPGQAKVVNDAKLHDGIPGTVTAEKTDPDPTKQLVMDLVFDPAIGAGPHTTTLVWEQDTGEGNEKFAPHEIASARLVIPWVADPDGTTPPPDPPDPTDPTAVDCAGTWTVEEFAPGKWHKVFVVSQQPSNGGKSCAIVAAEGSH